MPADPEIADDAPAFVRTAANMMGKFTPHAVAIGFEVASIARARAVGRIAYREDLIGDPETGVIAGGVIIAALDQICGMAAMAALDELTPVATLDLRIDYMRAATPGRTITLSAHCYKLTRSIAFVRALAFEDEEGDPIANATSAFMLTARPAQS